MTTNMTEHRQYWKMMVTTNMCGALGKPCTLPKQICCFIVDSECSTISQNKTVYIIKLFQPELDLQNF